MNNKIIIIVSLDKILSVIEDTHKVDPDCEPDGLYMAVLDEGNNGSPVIAVDNSTGDAWTEVFRSFKDGIEWLKR